MKKAQELAVEYFKINPQTEKLYATSDAFLFTEKQHATNHAKTLEDKKVSVFSNTGSNSETEENSTTETTQNEETTNVKRLVTEENSTTETTKDKETIKAKK